VESVDDYFNEQICDKEGAKNHVNNKNDFVEWVRTSFWLQANASGVNSLVHEDDPAFGCAHRE
jgi:hypothetical protein